MLQVITHHRVGDWIMTYTGKKYYPLSPRPEEVCLIDIAHSLSMQGRFGGHTTSFLTIAQHSVDVSKCPMVVDVCPKEGLLHDGGEAYLVDLPQPIKKYIGFSAEFTRVEELNQRAIAEHFNLEWPLPSPVHSADAWALRTEQSAYMRAFGGWEQPWSHVEANLRFLERALELGLH